MSRYISVLGLAARSCFLKGLAIMVVSVLLSGLLLYLLPEGVERESVCSAPMRACSARPMPQSVITAEGTATGPR